MYQSSMGIVSYTLDVDKVTTGQGPGWTSLLKSIARVSNGKYFDVSSTVGGEIANALGTIFTEILAVNSVFASVSLPVSVNTQGTYLNQVFIGQFRPDRDGAPRWNGMMMWRGTTLARPFLDGRTMVQAGHRRAKFVVYPIEPVRPDGLQRINWICDRRLRDAGRKPAFGAPGAFRRMEADFAALVATHTTAAWQFDELIIDEGQDFMEPWRDALLALLKPGGRAWWLEDPLQNLYDRAQVALPGWVGLTADTNYRTPADVLALLNARLPLPAPIRAGSPVADSEPEVLAWHDDAGLLDATKRAITRALGLGFRREMIVLHEDVSKAGHFLAKAIMAAIERRAPEQSQYLDGPED